MPDTTLTQREQWTRTFATRPDFLGSEPSEPGRAALNRFAADSVHELLELGPGQGRDTRSFAAAGLAVTAFDYAEPGLSQLVEEAHREKLAGSIAPVVGDVRQPLPFSPGRFDACYAHMLFCMALTTAEIERLMGEVGRVLRPGGLLVYTVRTSADAHFGAGIDHGDDRWEMGGFIVHFFDRPLIERLAIGWDLLETKEYEEGRLPRRLLSVTLRKLTTTVAEAQR